MTDVRHADWPECDASAAETSVVPMARPAARRGHPLGPLVSFVPLDGPIVGRLYAAGVTAAAVAVIAVAVRLSPSNQTMGTHTQLGLPPCGFVVMTGLPCPTCGMTTAFAHTFHGHLGLAVRDQLAGFVLAVLTAVAGLAALVATVTGWRPAINWYRVNPVYVIWIGCGLFVAAWAVKMVAALSSGDLNLDDDGR